MNADNQQMKKYQKHYIFLLVVLFWVWPPAFAAQDEKKEEGVKHNGVVFNIAKDRRIEKIGGIYEPEGIDKYVERRMDEVSAQIKKIELQMTETNLKLEQISKRLSESPDIPPSPKKDAFSQ